MFRKPAQAFFGIAAAACVALSAVLMLSCGRGWYGRGFENRHPHECIECQSTSECTAAIGAGWACLDFCCQPFADDDDNDNDDASPVDDDDDESPVEVGWLVGNTSGGSGASAVVLRTTDGGANWLSMATGLPGVNMHAVSVAGDQIAWVVGDADSQGYGTIYRTADGGQTWQRQGDATQFAGVTFFGVSAVDESHVWICGGGISNTTAVIAHSEDAGQTWTMWSEELAVDIEMFKVSAVNDRTVWAIGNVDSKGYAAVLVTVTGGGTWERVGSADVVPYGLIDLSAIDDQTAWIVGVNDTVIRTVNRGSNWDQWGVVPGFYHVNGVCAQDANAAWIAADQGGVYRIDADSENWIDVSPTINDVPGVKGYELIGICTGDGQSVWVSGINANYPPGGIIIHTADAGHDWAQQQSPVATDGFAYFSFAGACK